MKIVIHLILVWITWELHLAKLLVLKVYISLEILLGT